MPILRTNISDVTQRDGKTTAVVTVRAPSKISAIILARMRASTIVPPREQTVFSIQSATQGRFLDTWKVEIQDMGQLERALP